MGVGVRLACDLGSSRIGMARCDPQGLLATPLPAVPAGPGAHAAVVELAVQAGAIEIVVGLPLRLDGSAGPAAHQAEEWAQALREVLLSAGQSIQVRLVDERLTTVQAQRGLHAAGRSTRTSRQRIDSASAVVLLQGYLDRLQGQQVLGGEPVVQHEQTVQQDDMDGDR